MVGSPVVPEFAVLQNAAPKAYAAVVDALALAPHAVDPTLFEPMRGRIAAQFGADAHDERLETDLDHAIADLSDQFVFYVAGATRGLLQPVEDALSAEDLHELVKAMYTIDMGYRLRLIHRGLFAPEADPPAPVASLTTPEGRSLDGALMEIWRVATIMANEEVDDPEAIEFLRLRCAWYHDCHT